MIAGAGHIGEDELLVHVDDLAGVRAPGQRDLVAPRRGLIALVIEHVAVAEDLHGVVILRGLQRQIAVVGVIRERLEIRRIHELLGVDLIDLVPDVCGRIIRRTVAFAAVALLDEVAFAEQSVQSVLFEQVALQQIRDQVVGLRLGCDAGEQAEHHQQRQQHGQCTFCFHIPIHSFHAERRIRNRISCYCIIIT